MLKWMSIRGKDTWQFLFWLFLFTYVPIIPAYYIISLNKFLGLIGLVYVALSWSVIYKIYTRFEKYKNMKKTVSN
jgi:hypothetical protein